MFVVFTDGKILNISQTVLIEPQHESGEVRFRLSNGPDISVPMDEEQYHALVLSLQHNDPIHHVLPNKKETKKSSLDFRDFPSVLEGENSPV